MSGRKGQGRPRRSSFGVWFVAAGAVFLLIGATPTFVVVAVGLLPTLIAMFIDLKTGKSESIAVGTLNVAGILPFVANLWVGGHTLVKSFAIVSDVYAWLVMYGAAAAGFGLLQVMPQAALKAIDALSRRRVGKIKERQAELIKEWGSDIIKDAVG
jgi:hypothetical protein